MFSSVALTSAFTVLFLVTGVYAMVRLAALASGIAANVDRAAELSHLLMSVAMFAMTWGWSGGPGSPSGILQIVAFGLAGAYFLIGVKQGHRTAAAGGYHLVMAVAMVWMVATMPLLMGAAGSSESAMDDMPSMSSGGSGSAGPAGPGAHPWVLPISFVLIALMVASALFWALRAMKRADDQVEHCGPCEAVAVGRRGAVAVAVAVAVAPPRHVERLLSVRLDAACHGLMSVGMAGMLAAML